MATYKVFEIRHAIFFFLVEHILDGLKAFQYLLQSKCCAAAVHRRLQSDY